MFKGSPVYNFCIENHYCTRCGEKSEQKSDGTWYARCKQCRSFNSMYMANYNEYKRTVRRACESCGRKLKEGDVICWYCEYDNGPDPDDARSIERKW